jgi:glycosyltransferase involved in cell wall biosynthesis
MKNELSAMFSIPPARIVVMQHGMNEVVGYCGNSGEDVRRENHISEEQVVLLSFGKLAPYKGIDILLESFGMLDENYYLIIAGHPSSKEYENTILQGIATNRNKERILFINGYIDDADARAYFGAADVLVMPYRHIDQSGVLFLSMSMGLPVIAFNVGMLSQYVNEQVGLVVQRTDKYGLRDAVRGFRRERFDRNEIRNIATSYGWDKAVKPIVDLYAH